MTWKIDPSYTWHRCDAQGPLCATEETLVGDVAELPGGACLVCVRCVNKLAAKRDECHRLLEWCVGAVQAAINEIHDDCEDTLDACERLIEIKAAIGEEVTAEDRAQLETARKESEAW